MANIIRTGGGGSVELTGNAQPSDVIQGKTFYNTNPENKLTGTLNCLSKLGFTNVPAGEWIIKEGQMDINVANDNQNVIPLEVYVAFKKVYGDYHQVMYGDLLLHCGNEMSNGDAHCFCGTDLRKKWISVSGCYMSHVKYWLEKVGG